MDIAFHYHDGTKHHYVRYAASLGYMDWETQPHPFRRYEGAPWMQLPLPTQDLTPAYDLMYGPGATAPRPVALDTLSEFFFYSLAISAWKSFQNVQWSLRVNPSSGNLHPTEAYLLMSSLPGLYARPGIYHYAPEEHGLERRTDFSSEAWAQLMAHFPADSFLVGLTSIHWREAWKYGERAYRYCQHDAGHALAALRISAAVQGWTLRSLGAPADDEVSRLLGLDRAGEFHAGEHETPVLLAVVVPSDQAGGYGDGLPSEVIEHIASGQWFGKADPLSSDHHEWEIIDIVSEACQKTRTKEDWFVPTQPSLGAMAHQERGNGATGMSAGRIVRQRRSALAMDGHTDISRDRWYGMLSRLVPDLTPVPWDAVNWPVAIHLALFVHKVRGLPPGLYALARDPRKIDFLKAHMEPRFLWQTPDGCPNGLPLFLLREEDVRSIATSVNCGQEIAGDGAFSLGMIAEFEPTIQRYGAHFYRRLFWETGAIGQVLYLEAEAAQLRSTGIGCFFDDPVHQVFGITTHDLQSLYHFTVGGHVEDPRLTTLPSYPSLAWRPR
jgi:SagB-type dehydrogenase family enzyme